MESQVLECYVAMAEISAEMLDSAQRGDWDALIDAETRCAALVERLRTLGDSHTMSDAGARQKYKLIRKILDDDARIRDITQPWLHTLETLLRGEVAARKLQANYGGPC